MTPYLSYSINCGIALILMWLCFHLLLIRTKNTRFQTMRWTLLSILILSLLIPLISFHVGMASSMQDATGKVYIGKPLVLSVTPSTIKIMGYVASAYIIGVAIATVYLLSGWIRIAIIIVSGKKVSKGGYTLVVSNKNNVQAFSIGKFLVVSPNDKDNLAIIAHELSHIRHYHWVDLVIAQVLLIFQWWNPAAWFAMRDLRTIHEYQADAAVLNFGYNKTQYQLLLLNRVAQSTDAIISDSFDSGSLRRRIVMMGCKPKRYLLPFLVLIPLILSAVALPKFGDMAPYSPHVDLDEIAQDITAQFLSEIKYPAEVGSQSGTVLMEISFNPARQELYGAIVNSSGISAFDNEALRVVKSLKPDVSYIKGEASQITFTVPIIFKPS